ncbi:MAG: peptidase M48 Ste24p [Halothiobacillaceae bacterium]|nr:MAG: peptidase M48 Ste24p [Halothiobacillaceae bacterium]
MAYLMTHHLITKWHIVTLLTLALLADSALAFDFDSLKKKLDQAAPVVKLFEQTSPQEEVEIGRQVAGSLLGAAPLVNDAALQQYVNSVGRWVALQSDSTLEQWHFGIIDSADINAFAAPGGYILITRGLYALLDNEAELAGVLAHEIAHVIKQHHLKVMKKSQMLQQGEQAVSKNLGDDRLGKLLVANGAEILARGLDKEAEFEADQIGVVLAARAGYDPFALPAVLQKIAMIRSSEGSVTLLFKTHPHPDARLEQLEKAMGSRLDAITPAKEAVDNFYRLRG